MDNLSRLFLKFIVNEQKCRFNGKIYSSMNYLCDIKYKRESALLRKERKQLKVKDFTVNCSDKKIRYGSYKI